MGGFGCHRVLFSNSRPLGSYFSVSSVRRDDLSRIVLRYNRRPSAFSGRTSYAFGGPGFSVPMGLFVAGVTLPAAFLKLMPNWIIILGLALAAAGELSWLHLVIPNLLFLIPLIRFPGFIWLMRSVYRGPRFACSAAKLRLPNSTAHSLDPAMRDLLC